MTLSQLSAFTGEGRYRIDISAVITAEGISVTLTGGEKTHVGGVVMCLPRKSLTGQDDGCDTWIIPVPGHKDTEAAKGVAEMLCRMTGEKTVVVAGIHIDQASPPEIDTLLRNSVEAAEQLAKKLIKLKKRDFNA